MRFGMSGAFLPANMDDITVDTARRVRALGFSGIFTRLRANDPFQTSKAQCRQVRDLLQGEGIRMYQATGLWMASSGHAGEWGRTARAAGWTVGPAPADVTRITPASQPARVRGCEPR